MSTETALDSPYPGLRPFSDSESHLFFGRDRQTNEILRRLRSHRFVAIIGTSGCGKSSLMRAGVLPAIHAGRLPAKGVQWLVATMRPGSQPIRNLANSLAESLGVDQAADDPSQSDPTDVFEATLKRSSRGLVQLIANKLGLGEFISEDAEPTEKFSLLILVDQFEELFRYAEETSSGEATAFVRLLLEASQDPAVPIHIAITMRSDFFGECAQFPGLPELINDCQFLVPRMTRDELKSAITAPAEVYGATIAPRLLSHLVNDVGDDPDHLPVLQHALSMTWQQWNEDPSETIDLQHYRKIGGIEEALSIHANEAFRVADRTATNFGRSTLQNDYRAT